MTKATPTRRLGVSSCRPAPARAKWAGEGRPGRDESAVAHNVGLRVRVADEVRVHALRDVRIDMLAGASAFREPASYRGQLNAPGWYWSATTRGHVLYEFRLELARLLLADHNPDVMSITAQPFQLVAVVDEVHRRHTPDFLLVHRDRSVTVVNVKRAERLDAGGSDPRTVWAARVLQAHGWAHEFWSGCDPVLLANVRFLAGYRYRDRIAPELVETVRAAVRTGDSMAAVERRLARTVPFHAVRPALLHMLWWHRLRADLSAPLGGGSVLEVAR